MKNLKLFVFSLCLMLVAVLSVNAATQTCNKPGQSLDGVHVDCAAAVDGFGYSDFSQAWGKVLSDGGTLTLYKDNSIDVTRQLTTDITIDVNDNELTINGALTVTAKHSLTVKNGDLNATVNNAFNVAKNASLTLTDANATTSAGTLVVNSGTTTVSNGEITSTANDHLFYNVGTLSVAGTTVKAENLTADVVKNLGTVTLTNNTVTAKKAALLEVAAHESVANLVSGTYNVKNVVSVSMTNGASTDGKDPASVTITDGTYTAEANAIEAKKGVKLVVNGGSITSKTETAVKVEDADVTLTNGTITAKAGYVIDTKAATNDTGTPNASLTITGGKYVASHTDGKYVLNIGRAKATYAISGGTFESTGSKKLPAIKISLANWTAVVDDVTTVNSAIRGILTGGKYLNNYVSLVGTRADGATIELSSDLVADGYEVREEGNYKVIVKKGEPVVEPEKQPEATKPGSTGSEELPPDTYDAGLAYMGLALAAVGASVVSIKKLRNN